MIPADRFIETSDNRDAWLTARLLAVTATEVSKAATPSGFAEAVEQRRNPVEIIPNEYMQFGSDNEDWIARVLKRDFGVMPNHWLIAHETNPLFLATPDGLSLDHLTLSEIKTGGNEAYVKPPIQYRRQMQWQLFCTGAERCVYAFMLRSQMNGVFVPAWMEPRTCWVDRDEKVIAELVTTAERLLNDEGQVAA